MPQANIYLDEKEDEIIVYYSNLWNINKHETIKQIIKLFSDYAREDKGKKK